MVVPYSGSFTLAGNWRGELAKRRFEDRLHPYGVCLLPRLATQQVPAASVRDREWVYALAVAGSPPALEIAGPLVIRLGHCLKRLPISFHLAPLYPVLGESFPIQHRAYGACRRPCGLTVLPLQQFLQRARPPTWVLAPQPQHLFFNLCHRLVRMSFGCPAPLLQSRLALTRVTLQHRIAGPPRDLVRPAQVRHRPLP